MHALPSPAMATDQLELAIGFHTLPMLNPKWSGNVAVAIVYDPDNPASKADAENIKRLIVSGVGIAGFHLISTLIDVNELNKLSRSADASGTIAIITPGLTKDMLTAVGNAARNAGALSMSTDLDCVEYGHCILGLAAKPKIKILYNDYVAKASGIVFIEAFALMVSGI
jgi:ethanolamine ammonia-lyase large subunit